MLYSHFRRILENRAVTVPALGPSLHVEALHSMGAPGGVIEAGMDKTEASRPKGRPKIYPPSRPQPEPLPESAAESSSFGLLPAPKRDSAGQAARLLPRPPH